MRLQTTLERKSKMKTKRKFSTGTLGRIDEHADKCRTFVREFCAKENTSPLVANDFISEIQGSGKKFDNKNWEKFETMDQLKSILIPWLKGE